MKKKNRKIAAVLAAVGMVLLGGCGSTPEAANEDPEPEIVSGEIRDDETAQETEPKTPAVREADSKSASFTWLIDKNVESYYYDAYEDGPIARYWLSQEWDADSTGKGRTIEVSFTAPPEGSENNYVNTLIATEEYPDVMSMSYSSDKAAKLFEEGVALDITDEVYQYMPNYVAWMDAHPEFAARMTNRIDGEERIIQLYGLNDIPDSAWGGYVYRRDWIVKYGTDDEGNSFTGGYDDEGNWSDNVVFPSGNTDPIYISDWEWMLDIFQKALSAQQITDGYAIQLYYMGFLGTGDFISGFGTGNAWYYLDKSGAARFGGTEDGFRAYVECMRTWYQNGWIDPSFDERTNDGFFTIDTQTVYSGKAGAWYSTKGNLGNALDVSEGNPDDLTNGICVFGAPQPVNDIYGDSSLQGTEPWCYLGSGMVEGTSVIVTAKAEEKDVATLLTAMDYFYSREGGLMRSKGLSRSQQEELQDPFYNEWGLEDGAYDTETAEDGTERIVLNPARDSEYGLDAASAMIRMVGLTVNEGVVETYDEVKSHGIAIWSMYENTGSIGSEITNQLTSDQTEVGSAVRTQTQTIMSQMIPEFITGARDIDDDADWEEYCAQIDACHPEVYAGYINELFGVQ